MREGFSSYHRSTTLWRLPFYIYIIADFHDITTDFFLKPFSLFYQSPPSQCPQFQAFFSHVFSITLLISYYFILKIVILLILQYNNISSWFATGNRVTGWLTFILLRMEVMLMKNFDFKDLMSFAMFILALLTFIYLICH